MISTAELARIVGCTSKFIRDEIRAGHLKAVRIGRGHVAGTRLRIEKTEARRYCMTLGVDMSLAPGEEGGIYGHAFAAASTCFAITVGVHTTILAVNASMAQTLGHVREEMMGTQARDYLLKVEPGFVYPTEVPHIGKVVMRHKTGRGIPAVLSRAPFRFGGETYRLIAVYPERT